MQSDNADQRAVSGYVWYVILLLTLVNAFNYTDRVALSVLAPTIKAELELSDSLLGFLIGFAFLVFYATCAIPIARWADRGNRRNIIALAVATWSVMTTLSGAAQNFWHLLLARIGVGAGEAGSFAPGASILCDYVPLKKRSSALAIHASGNTVGIMIGLALAGWVGTMIGWRWTFVALGLPGLLLALAVRFTLREPFRGGTDAASPRSARLSLSDTIAVLWQCRTYRLFVFYWTATGFHTYGLLNWWPSFYARAFGLDLASIGVYLGFAVGLAGAIAGILGGFVANRLIRSDVRLPLRVAAAALAIQVPLELSALLVPSAALSMTLIFVAGVIGGLIPGPVAAAQYSVVRPDVRATAGSLTIFATSVLGGLGTFCVGVLSDWLASSQGAESLRYALLAPACLLPLMAVTLFVAARSFPNDLRTVNESADEGPLEPRSVRIAVAK